jgi:hypothetical protein
LVVPLAVLSSTKSNALRLFSGVASTRPRWSRVVYFSSLKKKTLNAWMDFRPLIERSSSTLRALKTLIMVPVASQR